MMLKQIQGSSGLPLGKLLETPILHEQREQFLEGHPIFQQHSEKNRFKKGCLKLEVFKLKQAWGENLLNSCSPPTPTPNALFRTLCVKVLGGRHRRELKSLWERGLTLNFFRCSPAYPEIDISNMSGTF